MRRTPEFRYGYVLWPKVVVTYAFSGTGRDRVPNTLLHCPSERKSQSAGFPHREPSGRNSAMSSTTITSQSSAARTSKSNSWTSWSIRSLLAYRCLGSRGATILTEAPRPSSACEYSGVTSSTKLTTTGASARDPPNERIDRTRLCTFLNHDGSFSATHEKRTRPVPLIPHPVWVGPSCQAGPP